MRKRRPEKESARGGEKVGGRDGERHASDEKRSRREQQQKKKTEEEAKKHADAANEQGKKEHEYKSTPLSTKFHKIKSKKRFCVERRTCARRCCDPDA